MKTILSDTTEDLRIESVKPLISPAILIEELPLNQAGVNFITEARTNAEKIIKGKDDRLLVIVGPCCIHDPQAALAYGSLLKEAITQYQEELHIIMRVYFEKPRATLGWKGLINDPLLDNSFKINYGLKLARKLLIDLTQMGISAGTGFLDTIIPQFISDLISWGSIGGHISDSQVHRELASGLSMPIGFKNSEDGNVQIAIDAIRTAQHPHHFLSVTQHGIPAIIHTKGNDFCHVTLRGSHLNTNYDSKSVNAVHQALKVEQLNDRIMIDCSHDNSRHDHTRQSLVVANICEQLEAGTSAICGVMFESNLVAGKQVVEPGKPLIYGKSITDACISWDETHALLEKLAQAVKKRKKQFLFAPDKADIVK